MFRAGRFTRVCSAIAAGIVAGGAGECGTAAPDYTAKRTVAIHGAPIELRVSVSGSRMREEQQIGGRPAVVLRLPEQHVSYAFDPETKRGAILPPPPPRKAGPTRSVDETQADGSKIRRLQVQAGGNWMDLSTTRCNAAGIMTHQTFTTVDPQGNVATGEVTQTDIRIAPLPDSLFRLPKDVVVSGR